MTKPWCIWLFCLLAATTSAIGGQFGPAIYEAETGDRFLRDKRQTNANANTLGNRVLTVVTIPTEPMMILDPAYKNIKEPPNSAFSGYCKDLLEELKEELQFNYTIRLAEDGLYGADMGNGTWSGLIGELVEMRADMAVADLSVTSKRAQAVDFTTPFMSSGLGVLYVAPYQMDPVWYAFLNPLTWRVWVSFLGLYIIAALILFLVARLSPYERNRNVDIRGEQRFTICECFWYLLASFFLRSSDVAPKALSTRIISLIWWYFSVLLLILYAYTVAHAYSSRINAELSISTVDDLAFQTKISYGTLPNGATEEFFKTSKNNAFVRMYRHMSLRTDDPPRNYAEGVERVLEGDGKYAFIMETPALRYAVSTNCGLSQVGREFTARFYAIALPLGSPYRSILNKGILQLRGDGTLGLLEEKWFGGQHQECEQDAIESFMEGLSSIGLYNFGPAFLVVIVGLFIALLVAVCELCVYSRQKSRQELRPLSHQFKDELQDSIRLKPQTTNHPPGLSPMAPQPGLQMQPLQTPISTTAPPMNPQQTPSPAMMPMNSPYHHSAPHHYPPGANPTQPGIGGQKPLPPFPNSYQGLS